MDDSRVLDLHGLTKTFGRRTVVDNVSFDVRRGEMFGFLGPNGSGKTTTIRMSLGIIRQESGVVSILGGAPERRLLRGVGYLPQERGLPRKVRVLDALRYLARLKGLTSREAERRALALLDRVGLAEHARKNVEDLSGGMAMLVQFVSAILHDPEFIILDEPFAGLDPLNVDLMKDMLRERQEARATILFSTHIMADVEELCQRVALISDSRLLLFGELAGIKRQRGAAAVHVRAAAVPARFDGNGARVLPNGIVEIPIGHSTTPESVLRAYVDEGIAVERFELALPSLNDIFVEEVTRARATA